jgi:hypothetical protein
MSSDGIPGVKYANMALAHFLVGLVKADGYISQAEERKIEILVHKFRHGLPGETETILADVALVRSERFEKLMPIDHVTEGFVHFDAFVKSGDAEAEHMETIIEMLTILAEVDGVSASEKLYMDKIKEGFKKRYGELK